MEESVRDCIIHSHRKEVRLHIPEKSGLAFRNTATAGKEAGTLLITGPPGSGKTRLACELARALVGEGETFLIDWPEEGGTRTVEDMAIPFVTLKVQKEVDELLSLLKSTIKPLALVNDSLPAMYECFMRMHAPTGVPPEDHGKTWRAVELDFKGQVSNFKLVPSVKWYMATSLIWPDEDDITGVRRLLMTVPGKLKGNAYGLFDYVINLVLLDGAGGKVLRVAELQPTSRTVAKVRMPPSAKVVAKVSYDLADERGVKPLLEALRLEGKG